jgi:hypothetical protein
MGPRPSGAVQLGELERFWIRKLLVQWRDSARIVDGNILYRLISTRAILPLTRPVRPECEVAQRALSLMDFAGGCTSEVVLCHLLIFGDALPSPIHLANPKVGPLVPFACGPFKPCKRFSEIPVNVGNLAQAIHCLWITLARRLLIPMDCGSYIRFDSNAIEIEPSHC